MRNVCRPYSCTQGKIVVELRSDARVSATEKNACSCDSSIFFFAKSQSRFLAKRTKPPKRRHHLLSLCTVSQPALFLLVSSFESRRFGLTCFEPGTVKFIRAAIQPFFQWSMHRFSLKITMKTNRTTDELIPKTIGNRKKRLCVRLRSRDKHHLRKFADRKAQISPVSGTNAFLICAFRSADFLRWCLSPERNLTHNLFLLFCKEAARVRGQL